MDWFSALFLTALVVSLLTGKAYCRGVIERSESPGMYWFITASYLFLAVFIPLGRMVKG